MAKDVQRLITTALRHKPELLDLHIDKSGYCSVEELVASLRRIGHKIDKNYIETVGKNERFSFNSDHSKIRADYGNSLGLLLSNMYSDAEMPPDILYHGTSLDSLEGIKEKGIIRFANGKNKPRDHVFLTESTSVAKKKGARHGCSVTLPINAIKMYKEGYLFYHAKLDIWLTDHVPSEYILFDYIIF